MATTLKLNYPDGSGTTSKLTMTTNVSNLTLSGIIDANVVDIQIDINGAGFISDPTLVQIFSGAFRVPNPESLPDGLPLEYGINTIRLRAIDLGGGVSPPAVVEVTVINTIDLGISLQSPTGVLLKRRAKSIDVSWSDSMTESANGYNLYASTGAGGTGSGYLRVNVDMIPAGTPTTSGFDSSNIGNVEYELSDSDGSSDLQIIVDATDPATGVVRERKSVNWLPLLGFSKYDMSITITGRVPVKRFVFNHDRADSVGRGILNSDVFGSLSDEDPLFYVVTALYFDKATGDYLESRYSQELSGAPLPLDKRVRGISVRDQRLVAQDYINEIQRSEPTLALIPGSTVREVHVEPFSNEAQKVYFLLDFVHRAKSFTALLAIDDPNLTGTSLPVDSSQYKIGLRSALSLADNVTVQSLIDGSFESLAQNFGIPRQGKRNAIVMQTFYVTTAPTKDLLVAQSAIVSSSINSTAPRFVARGAVFMYVSQIAQYWNVEKSRYEIKVEMVADNAGSVGNVSAGVLDTVVSGASGFKTVNDEAADFGRDVQSNLDLAETAMRALSSLDTGTEGGYYQTAVATPGVLEARIVKSGDPFMMRDWDPIRKKHTGGKVDIYVKGIIERTVIESFAFQFTVAKNVRFDVVDSATLMFRARDSRLTPSNPIREILNNPSQDYGIRNHSVIPTQSYDLTGVTIIDYNTIQINSALPQPVTMFDDFIEGDYRYRSNNQFVASLQPIRRITSVVGELSGTLDSTNGYDLYKTQDPLLEGESTLASDYVSIHQVDGVPVGGAIQINDEQHILIAQFEEPLGAVGINTFTLAVYTKDRLTQYQGPTSANPDYLVIEGTQTTSARIVRTTSSNIANGETVSVDYQHDENFIVTYVVNDIVQRVGNSVSKMRHVTADVAVKQSLENPLTMEAVVQLMSNANQSATDSSVRTDLTHLTNLRGLGNPIHQSDATGTIEAVNGVDYIVQPFAKFTLQSGAVRIREKVYSDYELMSSLNSGANIVYILTQSLPFDTMDGAGPDTVHVGVYMDELTMEKSPSLTDVGKGLNRWWVIGRLGAVIVGYSDDVTLSALFPADEIVAERVKRTANKVVVSLDASIVPYDVPTNHDFSATYIVSGDAGVKDISVSPIEYLTMGDVAITYKSA